MIKKWFYAEIGLHQNYHSKIIRVHRWGSYTFNNSITNNKTLYTKNDILSGKASKPL